MFSLVHLSDPHLGPLPSLGVRELASKRLLGYINWRRTRGAALGPQSLRALVEDLLAAEPDHIAVTGDLINLGLGAEIATARKWLVSLGDPENVTVVPGNHDAYLPGAIAQFEEAWRPFMTGDDATPHAQPSFPFVRRRGPIAIVGVSTALATAPLMATGLVSRDQIEELREQLLILGREGLFRVVLIHHPPIHGSTPWHKRLIGAKRFRETIAHVGAELILHGHNHRTSAYNLTGAGGPVPVVGATSASMHAHNGEPGGSYFLFKIARSGNGFICDMTERGATSLEGRIATLSERRLIGPSVAA